jgi:hypothetical protein
MKDFRDIAVGKPFYFVNKTYQEYQIPGYDIASYTKEEPARYSVFYTGAFESDNTDDFG